MNQDPVCGMTVKPESPHQSILDGVPYRFCSAKCKTKFDADPASYLAPAETSAAAAVTDPGAEYTCPMHPEVRQIGPGSCPKCGMALEPLLPELEQEEDDSEYQDFRRRFWGSLPLTVIVVVLAMAGHVIPGLTPAVRTWSEMLLSLPIVLWAGAPFFVRGWRSIIQRSPNMWTLIGIGTGAAFVYSVVAALAPELSGFLHGPRSYRRLFRGGRRHHLLDPARPDAGIACPFADFGRNQVAAWPGAQNRPPHCAR